MLVLSGEFRLGAFRYILNDMRANGFQRLMCAASGQDGRVG